MSRLTSLALVALMVAFASAPKESAANEAPIVPELANVIMIAGSTRLVDFYVSDPDGDVMFARKISGPSFVTVGHQGSNPGSLFGLIELAPLAADPGVHTVTVGVSDGIVEVTRTLSVTVRATGEPVFTQYSDMTVGADLVAQQTVRAVDPNVDDLVFIKVSGPSYLTVQTQNSYGTNAFAEVTVSPGVGDVGVTTGVIGVTDGTSTTTVTIQITVLTACPSVLGSQVPLPWAPRTSLLGDVNADGKVDLVAFPYNAPEAAVLHGNGDGTFGAAIPFTDYGGAVLLADFNGDGRQDLATAAAYSARIRLANVAGEFGPATDTPSDGSYSTPEALASADLNGDGHQDLILAYSTPSPHLRVLIGNGGGTFSLGASADAAGAHSAYGTLTTADFDGDGRKDVALGLYYAESVLVFLGDGAGGFEPSASYSVLGYGTHSISAGDLNSDGRPELAVARDGLTVLFNDGKGHFPTRVSLPVPYQFWSVAIGDLTGDGRNDVLATGREWFGQTRGSSLVFPGTGSDSIESPTGTLLGSHVEGVTLGDINGDGKLDWLATDRYQAPLAFLNLGCASAHHLILASAGVNGSIDPSGTVTVAEGGSQTFTITPDPGYLIADVLVDGRSVGRVENYSFTGVTTDHTIAAAFCLGVDLTVMPHLVILKDFPWWPRIAAYVDPPEPYEAADIDAGSLRLNGVMALTHPAPRVMSHGRVLRVMFNRHDFLETLVPGHHVPVTLTGTIGSSCLVGTDSVWVWAPRIHKPCGGDHLIAGSVTAITWDVDPEAHAVSILWSPDGGVTWNLEVATAPNTGSFQWTVPSVATDVARVQVVAIYEPDPDGTVNQAEYAASDAFSIVTATTGVGDAAATFSLRASNPVVGPLVVRFSLVGIAPATLAVYDIGGRRVLGREVGSLGAGSHMATLDELPAGVYVVRLSQGGRSLSSRVAVIR